MFFTLWNSVFLCVQPYFIKNKLVRTLSYSIFQQMCINFHEYWKLIYQNFALFKGKWSIKIYLHGIMKRNFTNILKRTIISHRNSLNTKRPWHMTFLKSRSWFGTFNSEHKKAHNIWCWKLRSSWLETFYSIYTFTLIHNHKMYY